MYSSVKLSYRLILSEEKMNCTSQEFFSVDREVDLHRESAFFSRLKMRNGTFKLTGPSRFRELDKACAAFIRDRAASTKDVLDLGVSTGVTTLELKQYLVANGVGARIVATDLFIDAHIVALGGGVVVLADSEGWPLQYDWRRLAFRSWIRRLDYATLLAVPLLIARRITRPTLRRMISEGRSRPVRMITRGLSADNSIQVVENDLLRRSGDFSRRFDFVRAANILNLGYFSQTEIETAVGNIASYLRGPGALVLVTRTGGSGKNAATLFELRTNGTFQALTRLGGGSEVEQQFLQFQNP